MHPAFQYQNYLLKRQVFALTGKFRVYNPGGQLLLYSQQKMFKLKEDIRVFSDETMSQEILLIQARQIIDFSAAYDVIEPVYNAKVGVLRRKGFRSMMRDEWDVLDSGDNPIGVLHEDNMTRALLRRLLLGSLLPQNYDLLIRGQRVADFRQNFNLFRYELNLDFSMDTANLFDRRLGIAAGILLGTIEGRQKS
jgi:hypothetical protein